MKPNNVFHGSFVLLIVTSLVLAACGGGGGSATGPMKSVGAGEGAVDIIS